MRQSKTPSPAPMADRGDQLLFRGYQPARALTSTPPQGGSGVPAAPPAAPAPATPPASASTPSGTESGRD